jgi:hypothetical protein
VSVEYITGDLLTWPSGVNVIAHCASCQNRFGSGIALVIKERYPAAFEADRRAFMANEARLGRLSVADVGGGRRIVNLYGQYTYGTDKRQVDYEGFYCALTALRDLLQGALDEGREYVLGIPYCIASDRARGSWHVIKAMIEDLFDASPIRCVIVQLPDPATPST